MVDERTHMSLTAPYTIVDLESTGTSTRRDRITEIAVIDVTSSGKVARWSSLVNPGVPLSGFIESLTGISNAMVRDAPAFQDLALDLRERLAGKLIIAHNARFDYGLLRSEFMRAGLVFDCDTLCSVQLSRALYPNQSNHKLGTLISIHNLSVEARHRAMADAHAVLQFLEKVSGQITLELLQRLIRRARAPAPLAVPAALDDETEIAVVSAILDG